MTSFFDGHTNGPMCCVIHNSVASSIECIKSVISQRWFLLFRAPKNVKSLNYCVNKGGALAWYPICRPWTRKSIPLISDLLRCNVSTKCTFSYFINPWLKRFTVNIRLYYTLDTRPTWSLYWNLLNWNRNTICSAYKGLVFNWMHEHATDASCNSNFIEHFVLRHVFKVLRAH